MTVENAAPLETAVRGRVQSASGNIPGEPGSALERDAKTLRKLEINFSRNKEKDCSEAINREGAAFSYGDCKDSYWNPPEYSLLYGTPLWAQASEAQRIVLNQLYWVAYYAQIISAEIATIHFNQTSATGLYALEGFRIICDTLDLESSQERAHIAAFKNIGEKTELALFGGREFTYPMRGPYVETIIRANSNRAKRFWRGIQLRAFSLLSSGNAFLASQYFTIRGLRTLNGKMVQHKLGQYYTQAADKQGMPTPSRISYLHFLDESYHFNSSTILSLDVIRSLRKPTAFERRIANMSIRGCQRDHFHCNTSVNGIFWHEPATFHSVYRILRSRTFGMDRGGALEMMAACFLSESEGLERAFRTHRIACQSYRDYLAPLEHVDRDNKEMRIMAGNDPQRHLAENRKAFAAFRRAAEAHG